MKKLAEILLIIIMVAVFAVPRLVGLGKFTSIDEPFWLKQSANFYYALGQRQFENTIYEYHPAVTTMWIITAGMLAYFPDYRKLGQGYLKPGKFDPFLAEHGKNPLQLLIVSRAIQVIVIILFLLVIYALLRILFDRRTAFFATTFISVSPFFLGQSRLLNHEAMLGMLIVISTLSMLVYLFRSQKLGFLLLSAGAAALAQLTKSSGVPILPVILLELFIFAFRAPTKPAWRKVLESSKILGIWLVALAAVYVIAWPGMWVAPGEMLSEVYGNALSYTFQGARLSVLPGLDATRFRFDTLLAGLQIYSSDLVWHTTILTWIGVVAGIGITVALMRFRKDLIYRLVVLCSVLLTTLFILLFSVQRGPKPPHYILTSFVALDLIASLGLSRGLDLLSALKPKLAIPWISGTILGAFIALQFAFALSSYPYYITYINPLETALAGNASNPTLNDTGYGVGLDQAAAYLSQKPGAADMTVMSANGYGSFSYYFPGITTPMNDLNLTDPQLVELLRGSQYAVVDYYNQKRQNILVGLEGVQPEKIIWIDGIDFLRIYRAKDLLASLGTAQP